MEATYGSPSRSRGRATATFFLLLLVPLIITVLLWIGPLTHLLGGHGLNVIDVVRLVLGIIPARLFYIGAREIAARFK